MDEVSRAFFELRFENTFLKRKGNAFQDFFADVMEKRHRADYIRIRAGGPDGDHKADGYLKSTGTIYQVYAPDQMTTTNTANKIQEDFDGACRYWQDRMACWTFVHNARNGLLPGIVDVLDKLGSDNPKVRLGRWGYEELRHVAFELTDIDLTALFGPAPSLMDVTSVAAADLQPVILAIADSTTQLDDEIRPVPPDKLSKNNLSPYSQTLLKSGMASANNVRRFFDRSSDPGLGDKVAASFKYRYGQLKGQGLPPDDIFLALRDFACGQAQSTSKLEAAVLAVLAFLFEQCDVFERPASEAV